MIKYLPLVLVLLLVACGPKQPETVPLYQGSEGVLLTFPPENNVQFYDGDEYSVALRLENKGAADITEKNRGYLSVVYDPAVFSFKSALGQARAGVPGSTNRLPVPFWLLGRARDVPVGEVDYVEFTFEAMPVAGNRETVTSQIAFQACYPYTTTLVKTICVDRDLYNTRQTQTCIGSTLSDSSQGAPVAVTSVKPSYIRRNGQVHARYEVTLRNLQDGYTLYSAYEPPSQLCDQKSFNAQAFNRLKVSATLSNIPLTCGTSGGAESGITRFDGREAMIICETTQDFENGANFESALMVQAEYFYISSVSAAVEVKRFE